MERSGPSALHRFFFAVALAVHAVFVISLLTGFLNPLFVEAVEGHGQASDFFGIYQAGANLVAGYSIYDSDDYRNEAPRVVPFFYFYRYLPPTAYFAAVGAVLFPPWTGYWIWVALNELLMAVLVASILRAGRWPSGRRWAMAALWLAFTPFYIEQIMGQFSFLMAAFLWVVWRGEAEPAAGSHDGGLHPRRILGRLRAYAWGRDRPGPVAVLLSWTASVTLKSFPALLAVPWIRDLRLKRILFGGLLGAGVCVPYFLFRPADLVEFARLNFSAMPPRIYKSSMGFRTLLRDVSSHIFPGGAPEMAGVAVDRALMAVILLAVLALALWASFRMGRIAWENGKRAAFDLLLWVAAFFLVFKSIWEYHYVMMLPALTGVYLVTGSRWVLWMGILLALPTLYAAAPVLAGVASGARVAEWPGWFQLLHFSLKTLPTLGLFGFCIVASRRAAPVSA